MTQRQNRNRVLRMVQFSILLAIEAIFCFVPWLGSIPFTPVIVATLSHVPVIITAILLGIGPGMLMGFFFGLFSFLVWTLMPASPALAFVFTPVYSVGQMQGNVWSLVICFVPRILIGLVAGGAFRALGKLFAFDRTQALSYTLAGLLGSLTNTVLVLGGIYVFFGQPYAAVNGLAYTALLGAIGGVILTNGIPEAIIGAVAAYGVCRPLKRFV